MEIFVFAGSLWKGEKEFSVLCPALDVASQGKTSAEAATLHLEGSFEGGRI
ncbi:MAG: hypothetical protein Q8L41_10225 [Anaerolineales bacterium]|nr:hypothetical protein [Anaerolineales bacterium]MDP2777544.1 hypothetical protein [Anaerolineales bacterium]